MPSKKNAQINEMEAAIESGSIARLKICLEQVTEKFKYERGRTPLHMAAKIGKKKMVEFLLSQNTATDTIDYKGNTPLHLAAAGAFSSTVELLLEAGSSVSIENTYGETALQAAAGGNTNFSNRMDIVSKLLDADISIDHANFTGQTTLHIAAMHGNVALVQLLLDRGATPDIVAAGEIGTPVQTAQYFDHPDVAELIASRISD